MDCEYFNNLSRDGANMYIPMSNWEILYSPCLYPYLVNVGISYENGEKFEQYPRGQIYLSSLCVLI